MTTEELIAENEYLRKKLQEERDYNQWVQEHRIKGYASGYLTRCAGTFMIEHGLAEDAEKTRAVVRKLANNPALDLQVRGILEKAERYISGFLEYRKLYYELRDTDKHLRQIEWRKKIAENKKEKAGD